MSYCKPPAPRHRQQPYVRHSGEWVALFKTLRSAGVPEDELVALAIYELHHVPLEICGAVLGLHLKEVHKLDKQVDSKFRTALLPHVYIQGERCWYPRPLSRNHYSHPCSGGKQQCKNKKATLAQSVT